VLTAFKSRKLQLIILVALLSACGIKSDPVPPVNPVNWGSGLQKSDTNKKQKKEKKDENR
tara:strand:- start:13044 stop:13223 length:180 start_codon:yes stop_codon:yes gene_type:complete